MDANTVNSVKILSNELSQVEIVEMEFYKQITKVQWLNETDQSTKLFYYVVKVKNKRQSIIFIFNDVRAKLDTQELISDEIVNFYAYLIGAKDLNARCPSVSSLKELVFYSLSDVEADALTKGLTDDEIKHVVGQRNDKSPGPDGFSTELLK
ncbi:hypothetical protein V6N13_052921 [Hibiscus sabdariffa]